jgi:hypothetical protein
MAGYSDTTLLKKLGIRAGASLLIVNEPRSYWEWISPLPDGVKAKKSAGKGDTDFIHLFVSDRKAFQNQFLALKKSLAKDGMLWVSWPKKSAKMDTDLDENVIREFGLRNGLVDVKVCAVDQTWSGLKFVYRLTDR